MPIPSGLSTITVTSSYPAIDGTPLSGSVLFETLQPIMDATGKVKFTGSATRAVNYGTMRPITLPCTDNSELNPTGFLYKITETINSVSQTPYWVSLPSTLGATVDLSALTPASSITSGTAFTANNTWSGVNTFTGETIVPTPVNSSDAATKAYTDTTSAAASAAASDLGLSFASPTVAVGETCPRPVVTGTSSASLVSGTVYMRAIGLQAGTAVHNLTLSTSTGNVATPASITHGWYALCDQNRTVVAVSTDQTGASIWNAVSTLYTLAVLGAAGATYTATYSGLYYVAEMVAVSAGNMPQFATSGSVSVGVGAVAPVLYGPSSSGQTTPPAIGTQLAAVSFTNSNAFYAYAS